MSNEEHKEIPVLEQAPDTGRRENAEQHRKYQTLNWDGNKTPVQLTLLNFLATKD
jgi:hypothetical protein